MIVVGRFHYYTSDDLDHHFRRLQSNDLDDESQVQELQNQKLKITRITSTQQIDVLQKNTTLCALLSNFFLCISFIYQINVEGCLGVFIIYTSSFVLLASGAGRIIRNYLVDVFFVQTTDIYSRFQVNFQA